MVNQNEKELRNDCRESAYQNKNKNKTDILPAGTPKQKSPYGKELDPTVPNRARTEMNNNSNNNNNNNSLNRNSTK